MTGAHEPGFAAKLDQLANLGFADRAAALRALEASGGDVGDAVIVLSQ